jgi:membrane protein YqaA with SNARE-associated domain
MKNKKIAKEPQFGLQHLLAIVLAISISIAILVFQEQIQDLGKLGYLGVFLISLLGNATTLLPLPGLAFIFLLSGALPSPALVAFAAALGAALGETTGYLAGYAGSGIISNTKVYQKIHARIEKYGAWAIFAIASIPNPLFDLAGIAAGGLKIPWIKFFVATFLGKLIVALAIAFTGARWLP